ncbi:thioredoxin-like protein CXXS1 [Gastrolobium bilobum]|uniref:thioredoxin-like protein CXXS1 n=1 Tax=Gastrolobium bilobum TaxID=150636 RepID=UPI002AB2D41C|nr:thioredoxin-like protein CXXS1 [Gastrolobium bilobum]
MAFDSHNDCNDWIIDTRASFHMTPHREWFCTYESYSGGTVRMGDDTTHAIVGRGKVKLKMSDGTVKNLPGVMHIPGLTINLISVGSMADAGRKETLGNFSTYWLKIPQEDCTVVVHFSAYWCMPSIAMNPFFKELASTYQDVLFLNVDVDEVKEVASNLEIKAMPTFLLMSGGAPVDKTVGANPDEIRKRIDRLIHQTHYSNSI